MLASVLIFRPMSKCHQVFSGEVHVGDIIRKNKNWVFDSFGALLSVTDLQALTNYIRAIK